MFRNLYAYGTLQVPALVARVIGRELDAQAATLLGYARYRIAGCPYPGIVEQPAGEVLGVLYVGLESADIARLDDFEGDLYERRELDVWLGARRRPAFTYVTKAEHLHRLTREPWDLARFEREHLPSHLAALVPRAPSSCRVSPVPQRK